MLLPVVLLLYSFFARVIRLSRQLGSGCLLALFCFAPSAATVGLFPTVFSGWGVCLLSGYGQQPPSLGGIWIGELCKY
jgi:hypothetical protein